MFEVAKAYEQRMGSWSKLLAPLFVEFVAVSRVKCSMWAAAPDR